jgi:hypothetical protein
MLAPHSFDHGYTGTHVVLKFREYILLLTDVAWCVVAPTQVITVLHDFRDADGVIFTTGKAKFRRCICKDAQGGLA